MLEAICILFLAFICLYEPLWGYKAFQQFQLLLATDSRARLLFYKSVIIGLWIITVALLVTVIAGLVTLRQTGLTLPFSGQTVIDRTTTIIVVVITALYLLALLYQWIMLAFNTSYREKMKQQEMPLSVKNLLPITAKEKRYWFFVSLTAGVTEEFIYRGFLLFSLSLLFPLIPLPVIVIVASLLFGMGHAYQGWGGVFKTSAAGLFFCGLYLATHSILPGMLLHFLQDYIARYLSPSGEDAGAIVKI